VLLCLLEGKTHEQAAREMGRPVGSLSRWLARGKDLLRRRLARRGIAVSGVVLGAAVADRAASAAVPPATLARAAAVTAAGGKPAGLLSERAVAWAEGVVRMTTFTHRMIVAGALLTAGALAGAGALACRGAADPPAPAKGGAPAAKSDEPRPEPAAGEKTVKQFLQDRLETAKDEFKLREADFAAGKATPDALAASSRRLLTAEAERAGPRDERVAAYEAHLKRMTDFKEMCKAKFDAGKLGAADLDAAEYERLTAEILLEREKAK
jgi:hypothetical protein